MNLVEALMLFTMLALLGCSGFFSGSETALFSLSAHQRRDLTQRGGLAGQLLKALLADTRALLITLMMGNMLINVSYFVLGTVVVLRWEDRDAYSGWVLAVAQVLQLLGIIMFGEVVPKLAASRACVLWSRLAALPLTVVHRVIAPIRVVSNLLIVTPLARLIAPKEKPPELSPEELETLLRLSQHHGVINPDEEQMLQQVLSLSQLKVRDLMTPRVDTVAFDLDQGPAALLDFLRQTTRNHIPVYRTNLDQIEGIVHARQALLTRPQDEQQLEKVVRQVRFVPEVQRADKLLIDFRKTGTTFAIVVDEFGGTAGVVTLEDVVEQMVGQILSRDETPPQATVEQIEPGMWRVDAELSVESFAQVFGQHAAPSGGLRTMGGLVMARLGRLPQEGDRVTIGNVCLEVASMAGRRVSGLWVRLAEPQPPAATPAGSDTAIGEDA